MRPCMDCICTAYRPAKVSALLAVANGSTDRYQFMTWAGVCQAFGLKCASFQVPYHAAEPTSFRRFWTGENFFAAVQKSTKTLTIQPFDLPGFRFVDEPLDSFENFFLLTTYQNHGPGQQVLTT